MEDFRESYNNLTLKTIMGLKWASTFCSNAQFVFKVDEDNFVNVDNLLRYLKKTPLQDDLLGGRCSTSSEPIRHRQSKWFVSLRQYPHPKYPSLCYGTAYVMSMRVAEKVFKASKNVPFFYLEDVYTTGLVANKKLGYQPISIPGFHSSGEFKRCYYKKSVIADHSFKPKQVRSMWYRVMAQDPPC